MPFSPKMPASMIGTFAMILVFTMLKEAYEDYFRHKADNSVNGTITGLLDHEAKEVKEIKWKDVCVGDIIKIKDGESFPADMIFISGSNENGVGFINTANLDGETNLKERLAMDSTRKIIDPEDLLSMSGKLSYDPPNMSLVNWHCSMNVNNHPWDILTINNLLLRGCQLKNTEFVYGLVVYTGAETKIVLNSKKPPSKQSNLFKKMNRMLYTVFAFLGVICISFAAGSIAW